MSLDEFIIKNKINLSDEAIRICEAGIEIMRKSINPLYNEKHVFSIISNLDTFLQQEKIDKAKINFDVLLLSICWHDVWRTRRFLSLSMLSFLFDHTEEGTGSMGMFSSVANTFGLDKETIREAKYAIRKHSGFQILPIKSLEGKILKDLDGLEEWSLDRIKPLTDEYVFLGIMDLKVMKLVKFYFDHFMVKDLAGSFHFGWPQEEFKRRKKLFIEEANRMMAEFLPFLPFMKNKK